MYHQVCEYLKICKKTLDNLCSSATHLHGYSSGHQDDEMLMNGFKSNGYFWYCCECHNVDYTS